MHRDLLTSYARRRVLASQRSLRWTPVPLRHAVSPYPFDRDELDDHLTGTTGGSGVHPALDVVAVEAGSRVVLARRRHASKVQGLTARVRKPSSLKVARNPRTNQAAILGASERSSHISPGHRQLTLKITAADSKRAATGRSDRCQLGPNGLDALPQVHHATVPRRPPCPLETRRAKGLDGWRRPAWHETWHASSIRGHKMTRTPALQGFSYVGDTGLEPVT